MSDLDWIWSDKCGEGGCFTADIGEYHAHLDMAPVAWHYGVYNLSQGTKLISHSGGFKTPEGALRHFRAFVKMRQSDKSAEVWSEAVVS